MSKSQLIVTISVRRAARGACWWIDRRRVFDDSHALEGFDAGVGNRKLNYDRCANLAAVVLDSDRASMRVDDAAAYRQSKTRASGLSGKKCGS
jgi:hypothetical protein